MGSNSEAMQDYVWEISNIEKVKDEPLLPPLSLNQLILLNDYTISQTLDPFEHLSFMKTASIQVKTFRVVVLPFRRQINIADPGRKLRV